MSVSGTELLAETVLLVEDGLDDVLLARRAFRKVGLEHTLRVCSDGAEAVAYLTPHALSQHEFDRAPQLVLLDWKLPKRSGLEVLCWIRAQVSLHELPIVIVSASGQPDEMEQARSAGANAYLHKPLTSTSLLELLQRPELAALKACAMSLER